MIPLNPPDVTNVIHINVFVSTWTAAAWGVKVKLHSDMKTRQDYPINARQAVILIIE